MSAYCVLIPVFNEESTIGRVIDLLKGRGLDILVVDDGSHDKSHQICVLKGVEVLRNEDNKGKGYSILKGLEYLQDKEYEAIILIDGDGQHNPSEIDKFLELFEAKKPDLIIGNRMGNPKDMPFIRRITNRFMSFLISLLCRQEIKDSQCGYRLISKNFLKKGDLRSRYFEIESEMILEACRLKMNIMQLPVESIYKRETSNIHPLRDTLRFIRFLVRWMREK